MKKLVFTLFFAVFSLSLSAQQLANGGFENWSQPSYPNGWSTFASGVVGTPYAAAATFVAPAATQDVGYVGVSSIKLTTLNTSATLGAYGINTVPGAVGLGALNPNALTTGTLPFLGTAFPYRPDTLFFAYKYTPTVTDSTAVMELIFLRGGNVVAQGYTYALPAGTWGVSYVPIADWVDACPPDSIILNFMSSSTNAANVGSVLNVDTVFFRYATPPALPTVSIVASQSIVPESVGTVTYTATLSAPNPCGAISIPVTFSGTATNPADYSLSGTSFNFAIGATTSTITVTVVDDAIVEPSETIIATLGTSSGAVLGTPSSATITITDNDLPTLSISASPISISENGGTSTITATLSQATSAAVTVTLAYSGTAVNGTDYNPTPAPTTITIPAGSTTGSVTVTAVNNLIIDGNRTIIATESVSPNATLGSTTSTTITIIDDDTPPTVSISASPTSISENGGTSTITATLSHSTSAVVTVTLAYSGTAVNGTDYNPTPALTTITIPAGSTTGSVTVTGIDNSVIDGNRTVTVTESSVSSNATIGSPSSATITITDDDAPTVSISVDSAQIHENGGVATVTITMSHPNPTFDVTANLIYGGSATSVGPTADFFGPGSVIIPSGSTTKTFTLSSINDALVEGSETIIITISNASNGTGIGSPSTAVVTILDDDTAAGIPYLSIAPSSSSVTEGANVTLTASLSALSPTPVTASVVFTGTAVAPSDYSASATSVTIPAGSLTATITLSTVDDIYYEGTRIVFASLAEVTGGALLGQPATASISILDNESTTAPPPPPPILPIDSATLGISNVNVLDAIKVYPVPAQDFVKVSIGVDVPQIVTLVDMQGRLVKEMPIVSGENTMDLSSVNSGTYILRFTNEQYNYFTGAKPITVVK